jgi:hypothetical protein
VSNRDASNKDFDPSNFDDVLELVRTWTRHRSMTASQIVEGLRARGVVVRATTSGRHVIIETQNPYRDAPWEAKLVVVPPTPRRVRQWFGRARDPSPPRQHVIRPPGQALHRVAGLFSKRTRERVLDPIIADMQAEYCEALAVERPRKVKLWWVQARAWVAFAEAIFLRTVVGRIIRGLSRLARMS